MPDLFLAVSCGMLIVAPTQATAISLVVAGLLWAFHQYFSKPVPPLPKTDEARMMKLENELKDASKAIDSLKNAAGIRQLR